MDRDLIDHIANLLQISFTSVSAAERKYAEDSFQSLASESSKYFEGLLCIISSSMSQNIKNSAGLQLKRLVRDSMSSNAIDGEMIENWGEMIYHSLIQETLDPSLRANLAYALLPLLSLDSPETGSGLLVKLFPHIIEGLQKGLFGTLRLIRTLYSGYTFNPVLYQYFLKLIPSLAHVVYGALSVYTENTWEVLEETSCCIYAIAEHFGITAKYMLIELQAIPEFCVMLKDLINADLLDKNLPGPSIIHVGTDVEHAKYNATKTYVFKTINLLIQCLKDYKKKGENKYWDESPMVNMLDEQLFPIINSLNCVVSLSDYEENLQLEFVSDLINEILSFIGEIIPDLRFFNFFNENYRNIIVNICMPLIKTNANDLDCFVENPEEFINFSNDLCEKQQSDTYKSSSVQVFLNICEYIDGALSFTWQLASVIVDNSIRNQGNLGLEGFSSSQLVRFNWESLLDCGLLCISALNSLLTNRNDLIQHLDKIFSDHLAYFFNASPLIKNRICLIVRFYVQVLFIHEENKFFETVKFVVFCCNTKENKSLAVNGQASETLTCIFQDEEALLRIYNFLPDIIRYIIEIIKFQQGKGFFEALFEMVDTNISVALPHLDSLIPNLVEKIAEVHRNSFEDKKRDKIVIEKCWSIIQCITNSRRVDISTAIEIENTIVPLLEYLKNPVEIEFDEKILQFQVTLMKKCEAVTRVGWGIFELLPLLQSKYKGSISNLFTILNSFLHYGKTELVYNKPGIDMVIQICNQCFYSLFDVLSEVVYSECCLLYQQLLINFTGMLEENFLTILMAVLKKSDSENKDFYMAKLFGVIFACIIYNVQAAVICISQYYHGNLDMFIGKLWGKQEIFTNHYDIKLAVMSLSILLEYTMQFHVFRVLITLLSGKNQIKKQNEAEKNETTLKISKKNNNFSLVADSELEVNLRISTMQNSLKDFDEYNSFRNLLKTLQSQNPNGFTQLVQSLHKEEVSDLTEIIKSQRVQISGSLQATEIRKIVKPKLNSLHN